MKTAKIAPFSVILSCAGAAFWASAAHSQQIPGMAGDCCTPKPPLQTDLCEQKFAEARVKIAQTNPTGFFRKKIGYFCTTPIVRGSTLVTSCNDGTVKFLNLSGQPVKSLTLATNPDNGLSGDSEIVALAGTKPAKFLATILGWNQAVLFDETGKILKKFPHEGSLSKPTALASGQAFYLEGSTGYFIAPDGTAKSVKLPDASYNDPSAFASTSGKNTLAVTTDAGKLLLVQPDGEPKTIELSKSDLSVPAMGPDGKLWISDATGAWYVVDPATGAKETFKVSIPNAGKMKIPTDRRFSKPIFLKNGTVAFMGDERVYFYDPKSTAKPMAVFERGLAVEEVVSHSGHDDFFGAPMQEAGLASVALKDGTELVWVPARGGSLLLNTNGTLVGINRFTKNPLASDNGAESLSVPVKLADGTYVVGSYHGVERYALSKNNAEKIFSSGLVPCP